MKKEDIHLDDIHRILFGQAPPIFLLEVFIRTLIIYVTLLYMIRWLGKRMSGQLTIMELAVMLTLGAIICVPMQIPDRGLLQGAVLLVCAVWFQRGTSLLGVNNGKFEDFVQGKASVLVKDGVLLLDEMEKNRVSRQQIFSQLRKNKIFNLGMVDRLYLEACGIYSIFKAEQPKPGLSLLTYIDPEVIDGQKQAILEQQNVPLIACKNCGYIKPKDTGLICNTCGNKEWVKAII